MNLFSQSKLKLKLKKQNNNITLSTDSTNKCQDSMTSDCVKSENNVSNKSVLSENDSFVEILHSVRPQDEKMTMSQNIFKTSPVQNVCDVINESKQCPVCSQMLDVKHFINHVKTCGSSHNLSSEVLIKAVNLQERQAAEREALGLPKLTKSRDVKKKKCSKQTKLKVGCDSNFDLALAMSVSLQESKAAEIIKESETLLEAGLETEAIEKRKTLESFGFLSNQPIKSKSKNFYKSNSLLFKQTQEDREKRITEKVAMILIDCDTETLSSDKSLSHCPNIHLRSKFLNKMRNSDCKLWKKSLLEEDNILEFYVKNISKFLSSPSERNGLQNIVKFPAHQNTMKQEPSITNHEIVNTSNVHLDDPNVHNKYATDHNIVRNKTIPEYSSRWQSMIGNHFMSDLTIFSKDEHEIPAHILVFHVQCPDILNDILTETSGASNSKKLLMWSEYTYEACVAFLDLIYSGKEPLISSEHREDYLNLGTRYNVQMLITDEDGKHGWLSAEQDKVSKRKSSELYSTDSKRYRAFSPDMFMMDDISETRCMSSNFLGTIVNDEKSFSLCKTKQWLNNCSQHHDLSFTENLDIDGLPQTITPLRSPAHSFHSTSTVHIRFSPSPNHTDNHMEPEKNDVPINPSLDIKSVSLKSLSTGNSSILMLNKTNNIPIDLDSFFNKISTLPNSCKEPELITIDSDNESIDMIFPHNNSKLHPRNSNLLNKSNRTSIRNKNNNYFLFNSSNTKCNDDINVIDLNDSSLDSTHSASTNTVYKKNDNTKFHRNIIKKPTMSTPRIKTINIDDEKSAFSTVIRSNTQMSYSKDNNFIDLVNESSSDSVSIVDNHCSIKSVSSLSLNKAQQNCYNNSTPLSNVMKIDSPSHETTKSETNDCILNALPLEGDDFWVNLSFPFNDRDFYRNIDTKANEDMGSTSSSSNRTFLKSNNSTLSSKSTGQLFKSCTQVNDVENNDNISKTICSNEKKVVEKSNSYFEQLENILEKNEIIPSNSMVNLKEPDDLTSCLSNELKPSNSIVNLKEPDDLTSCSSNELKPSNSIINLKEPDDLTSCSSNELKHTSFRICSSEVETVTTPKEKDDELNKSAFEQLIDDPWMDYNNDWQPVHISPQYVSPVFLERNSVGVVNESEVSTTPPKSVHYNNMDLQTSSPTISSNVDIVNHQTKNAVTPNKYGSRICTPKSLRRVHSESVIGTNEQITPLPNYSSMKTPDLRKEFDRYGLKDLGRRKGKLILRHIYDVLHPTCGSEEAKRVGESEQNSDSSDSSEHGIPDNEVGIDDEFETLSQTNLSNKNSIDMGFKDLLKVNEDFHKKILCYEPIWIEELKEDLKKYNVNISMQKLMTFLDDKCVTFRSKSLNDQRQKPVAKKITKRKKLF